MSDIVLALSIEETNQLRRQLGLQPLRIEPTNHTAVRSSSTAASASADASRSSTVVEPSINNRKERLELSVDETNRLRQQLGLAPLKIDDNSNNNITSTKEGVAFEEDDHQSTTVIHHRPAINEGERQNVVDRMERAKLKRDVETNLQTLFATPSLGSIDVVGNSNSNDNDNDTTNATQHTKHWAQRMRTTTKLESAREETSSKQSVTKNNKKSSAAVTYQEQDLHGLHVGHSISEFEDGSTTIMTLTDVPLLQTTDETNDANNNNNNDTTTNDDVVELQNVQLVQRQRIQDGLREKRKMELGLGRAGGYVGYDDDEFEELGGTQGPSRLPRNNNNNIGDGIHNNNNNHATVASTENATTKRKRKGFQIGNMLDEQDAEMELDIISAIQRGKAISLVDSTTTTNADVTPSDYMTQQEYTEQEQATTKMNQTKKKKKTKKLDKHEKKRHKRRTNKDDSDDDENENDPNNQIPTKMDKNRSLLDELDATAVVAQQPTINRIHKRRNRNNDDDDDDDNRIEHETSSRVNPSTTNSNSTPTTSTTTTTLTESLRNKRARYDHVMAKGNERSQNVFAVTKKVVPISSSVVDDDEPDDAFLNAALEKARRLNRLKALAKTSNRQQQHVSATKGADAVVAAIQHATATTTTTATDGATGNGNTIAFTVDETQEFTRTLLARTEQMEREHNSRFKNSKKNQMVIKMEPNVESDQQHSGTVNDDTVAKHIADMEGAVLKEEDTVDMDVDIHELAKQVKVEDTTRGHHQQHHIGLDGTTTIVPKVGRGVGGLLQFLQQSGELQHGATATNARKKEEMRGRAKDKRTYEDYEPLDLSKVVRIDERNATEKDRELASREVKLEYRDAHGRLLTRKEAFRDLSYQFHGYGSGKRKQEKKLEQISREQAEARIVSQQLDGSSVNTTFGALKETQRATGKAFVIHKTGV